MKKLIDYSEIRNLLTIRYNPEEKPMEKNIPRIFPNNSIKTNKKILEKLLIESIKNQCENHKKISVSLSGGIDSSLVLGLLRKTFPEKKIFGICGIFEDTFNESDVAQKNCDKFNADFQTIKMGSIFENMPELISITKKPKWNTYQHLIAKNAKKFSKILLTGDGADEIFGGYVFRYSKFLNLSKDSDTWQTKSRNYLECHNRDWVADQEKIFNKKCNFAWSKILNYFKPYFSTKIEPLNQVFLADLNGKLLFDFIPTGVSIGNYHDLKINSIFLNKQIIQYGLSLPINKKFNPQSNLGKIPLREICKDNKIFHIPNKKGFSPSLLFDWKKNGKEICQKFIFSQNAEIYKKNIINYDWVMSSLEKIENDGDIRYLHRLISILALEIWIKIFITNELKSNKKL
tara:strand:- start:1774 stop:2979 length:1206 start_codon:yes stop_codon:yes gene_type:complete